jgi:hypothetical protein
MAFSIGIFDSCSKILNLLVYSCRERCWIQLARVVLDREQCLRGSNCEHKVDLSLVVQVVDQ